MMTRENQQQETKNARQSEEQASLSENCGCIVIDSCGCYVDPCCAVIDEIECYETSCGCLNFR